MANQKKQKPGSTLYAAQERRTRALAEREELRNLKLKGELVSKEEVEKEWFRIARQVRDALLNIPARLAGVVSAEKNYDKNFASIEQEIRQALEGLPTAKETP